MREKKQAKNEQMAETIKRWRELGLRNRALNEMKLNEDLSRRLQVGHLRCFSGEFLAKKDQILGRFKLREGQLAEIRGMFFGNQHQRESALRWESNAGSWPSSG